MDPGVFWSTGTAYPATRARTWLTKGQGHDRTQVTTILHHTQSSDRVEGQMGGEAFLTW